MHEQPASRCPRKILVIDDEELLLDAIQALLAPYLATVTCCSRAEEALEELSRQAYDLVLTDLTLPDLEGERLIREIRERSGKSCKLLIMTGSLNLPDWLQEIEETRILQKPFDRHALNSALRGWVANRDE